MNKIDLNLNSLAKGALAEDINEELAKVGRNLIDPNVKQSAKRELNLKITFKIDADGTIVTTSEVKSKLAPREEKITRVLVGENGAGNIEMREMNTDVPGQTMIDPESGQLLTDTGEPVHGETTVAPIETATKKYI
ncbi:replication terminator protein [Weissella kandleri]|uniref:replication terminator protein n=1 Tax=Weissella kandleri TaxID=1616 RepID=UPI00387E8BCE